MLHFGYVVFPRRTMIRINEQAVEDLQDCRTIGDLRARFKPDADVCILNGFPVPAETPVQNGDTVALIRRGEQPSYAELEHLMVARHTPGVHEKVKQATVGICGVGGLGTMLALCLARLGVGRLILIDHDVVEPSNLNRQQFFVDQIGLPKVEAMAANLARANPYLRVETHQHYLTPTDYPLLLRDADVVAECFDNPTCKAEAYAAARTCLADRPWVLVSGLAGSAPADQIRTRWLRPNVVLVGDESNAAQLGRGLMAPRVAVAAGKQANVVLNLLIGEDLV